MKTATVHYEGDLRTLATHIRSGSHFYTDAPVDNQGKGAAFSPTDLVGAALLSCMITTMAIAAKGRGWELGQLSGDVLKIMADAPRRIAELSIEITFTDCPLDAEQRQVIEGIGRHCPVARGLHPDMVQNIVYKYV